MGHEEACRAAGIDYDTWRKYRSGGRTPSLPLLEALATVANLRLVLKPIYEEEKKSEKRKNVKPRR